MRLYDLAGNYLNIWSLVDDETMDLDLLEAALQELEGDMTQKCEGLAAVVKTVDAEIDAIAVQIKRLQAREKALKNGNERLKNYAFFQLKRIGKDKIKGTLFTVAIRKNPVSLEIIDPKLIPAEFLTVVPETYVPNNETIKKALQHGQVVDGARLVQKERLQIN